MFDLVIINDDLERAYEELKEILDEVSESTCDHTLIIVPIAKAVFPSFYPGNQKSSGSQIVRGRPFSCLWNQTFVSRTSTKGPVWRVVLIYEG